MQKERKIKIAPSILSANFTEMGAEIKNVESAGADLLHIDVMDGVFVPNISFGIKMVEDIRKITNLPLDCHLMIVNPERYVERFGKAGADYITIHYEACKEKTGEVLSKIKSLGVKAGLAFNPDTSVELIEEFIPNCDLILVMSVFPGFGGQKFIEDTLVKCEKIREIIDKNKLNCELEIDGGINADTSKLAAKSGCDILVAGSAVFNFSDRRSAINALK